MIGLEPITCWLQISCSANWATSAFILLTPTGFEPMFSPWEGDVLTTWPRSHNLFFCFPNKKISKTNSPSWARTNNPSVNSRMLYHWAIEEYHESIFCWLKHHVPSKPPTESYYIHPIIASLFWTFLTLPCFEWIIQWILPKMLRIFVSIFDTKKALSFWQCS